VFEDTASHKEGVSVTYRKVNGYAPIFCYAGREGFMVASELRPGSQHSENGAVEFLKRCIAIMLWAGYKAKELLVRVDSGHDSSDFIKALEELEVKYLVKRNLRMESPEQLLDSIRFDKTPEQVRPGKAIYRGVRSDKRLSLRQESASAAPDFSRHALHAQCGVFSPWFAQDDNHFQPELPTETKACEFSGNFGQMATECIPADSLYMMRFTFESKTASQARVMFNTTANCRVWLDGAEFSSLSPQSI